MIVTTYACPACGGRRLVLVKQLATGLVFGECAVCSTFFTSSGQRRRIPASSIEWERSKASLQEALGAGWDSVTISGALPDFEEVADPRVVAAWLALDLLELRRAPWWAANRMLAGQDGEAMRLLAGESGHDRIKVRELLLLVLEEQAVSTPTVQEAGLTALNHIARLCLAGSISEREAASLAEEAVLAAGSPAALWGEPAGNAALLGDEYNAQWGRSSEELALIVRDLCREQLRQGR